MHNSQVASPSETFVFHPNPLPLQTCVCSTLYNFQSYCFTKVVVCLFFLFQVCLHFISTTTSFTCKKKTNSYCNLVLFVINISAVYYYTMSVSSFPVLPYSQGHDCKSQMWNGSYFRSKLKLTSRVNWSPQFTKRTQNFPARLLLHFVVTMSTILSFWSSQRTSQDIIHAQSRPQFLSLSIRTNVYSDHNLLMPHKDHRIYKNQLLPLQQFYL